MAFSIASTEVTPKIGHAKNHRPTEVKQRYLAISRIDLPGEES